MELSISREGIGGEGVLNDLPAFKVEADRAQGDEPTAKRDEVGSGTRRRGGGIARAVHWGNSSVISSASFHCASLFALLLLLLLLLSITFHS